MIGEPAAELGRRARLANMRQELLAPVSAIVGYAEILQDEAARAGLGELEPDLARLATAAAELQGLVDRLLDTDQAEARSGDAGADAGLRHDLRNPLSAIKGYGELLQEEVDELGALALQPDLERLLAETERLLAQIDVIVVFGRDEPAEEGAGLAVVEGVLRSIAEAGTIEHPEQAAGGRILVVDDNPSNRDILIRRLVRDGHAAEGAASGRLALERLAAEPFDVVLLDLMMPDLNGFEVLRRIRTDPAQAGLPVIMISGLSETDSVIRCIEAGADDYLTKPFNPVLLRARIGACLERKRARDRERYYLARLEAEKERVETLLHSILPTQIVARLNGGELVIADRVEAVTILFCDLVGFTPLASRLSPSRLVARLNGIFSAFDALTARLGLEKIKTIGDAYMVAAGLPEPRADHVELAAELALGLLDSLGRLQERDEARLQVRIGLHTGPVVAGVIGRHRFLYDVWGETVNLASRLEAQGLPDRIHVSAEVRRALEQHYTFEERGPLLIKGVGELTTHMLTGRRTS